MIGLGLPEGAASPYRVLDAAAVAYATAMAVAPSAVRLAAIDGFVRALKAADVFARLDILYLLAAHHEQAARLNLRSRAHDATAINSPGFVADRGFAGDGATSYLTSGLNLAAGTIQYAQDSATMFIWSLSDVDAGGADAGSGTSSRLMARTGGYVAARANATSTTLTATADSLGLIGWTRNGAAGHDFFRGGSIVGSAAMASGGISGGSASVCRGGASYSPRRIAVAGFGAGLDAPRIAALAAACEAYLQAVGAVA